ARPGVKAYSSTSRGVTPAASRVTTRPPADALPSRPPSTTRNPLTPAGTRTATCAVGSGSRKRSSCRTRPSPAVSVRSTPPPPRPPAPPLHHHPVRRPPPLPPGQLVRRLPHQLQPGRGPPGGRTRRPARVALRRQQLHVRRGLHGHLPALLDRPLRPGQRQ